MRRQVNTVQLNNAPVQITWADGGLNLHEDYDNTHAYVYGDVVTYNGSSYAALGATTGNLPTDATFWQLLASKGDQGPAGPKGLIGDTGADGPTGPQGNPGQGVPAAGTTGQVLMKESNADYDTDWRTFTPVPAGGLASQVLSKVSGTDYDLEWVNQNTGSTAPIPVSYSDLFNTTPGNLGLIQQAALVPGQLYSIDDFRYKEYVYYDDESGGSTLIDTTTGAVEPIIVMATSESTLSPWAYQPAYPNDIIEYSLTVPTKFAGESAADRGMILWREDTHYNIALPCDWRNAKLRLGLNPTSGKYVYARVSEHGSGTQDFPMVAQPTNTFNVWCAKTEHFPVPLVCFQSDVHEVRIENPNLNYFIFADTITDYQSGMCNFFISHTTANGVDIETMVSGKVECISAISDLKVARLSSTVIIDSAYEISGLKIDTNTLSSCTINGDQSGKEITNSYSTLFHNYDAGATSVIDLNSLSPSPSPWVGVINLTFDGAEQVIDTYTITSTGRSIKIVPAAGKTAIFRGISSGGDIICNGDMGDYVEIEYRAGAWRLKQAVIG